MSFVNCDPVLTLTPAAISRVRYLQSKRSKPSLGLRVGVKGGGCSGFSYVLKLEDAQRHTDLTWEQEDIRIFVDGKSAEMLQGLVIDFNLANLMGGGFLFHNPNASKTCGCGTSFDLKDNLC